MLTITPVAVPAEELAGKYLTCFLGWEPYGIPVGKVREIFLAPGIRTAPRQAGPPRGTATLRGVTVPVIDLRRRLPFPDENGYAIVTETDDRLLGVLVDDVEAVAEAASDAFPLLDVDRIARSEAL